MAHPCTANPELWFGYPDDDSGDGAAKARAYERSATEARIQCLRRCPLAQQRQCAQRAIKHREEYGVWAGVKLPGGQYPSANSSPGPTRSCAVSQPAKSTPDNSPKMQLCSPAVNTRPFRSRRWCCTCPRHGLVHVPPPSNASICRPFVEAADGVGVWQDPVCYPACPPQRRTHDVRPDTNGSTTRPGPARARVRRICDTPGCAGL